MEDLDKTKRLLATVGRLTGGGSLLSVLANFGGIKLSLADRRFLEGPFIVHDNPWRDSIPKWMFTQAVGERAEIVFGLQPQWIVGPTEIAAVMYPAMMAHPMRAEAANLYFWATAKACAAHYGKPEKHYWQSMNMKPIADAEILERGSMHSAGQLYREFAPDIRRKVETHAAAYVKAERAERIVRDPEQKPEDRPVIREQYSLFKYVSP